MIMLIALADIDCETVGERAVVELKTTNTFNFNPVAG